MTPNRWIARQPGKTLLCLAMGFALVPCASAEEAKLDGAGKQPAADVGTRDELKLPGLTVYTEKRYIDVEATVCLGAGFLELIACTKDSKEHEAIIAVDAKPSQIHAALLLLRAQPGSPAVSRRIETEGDGDRWLDLAPSGSEVDVFLAFKDPKGELKEHPISDFMEGAQEEEISPPDAGEKAAEDSGRFPTHTFLFAGSQLYQGQDGKARYLSDESGNVISLATFGDELLCLPGKHSQDNAALTWEIDPTHLPPVGTKVILRLRPKPPEEAPAEGETDKPKP